MVLHLVEPGEDLHHIVYFFLLLAPGPVQPDLLPEVKQPSRNHELLPPPPLAQLLVVGVDQSEFHSSVFLGVLIGELHLCQQQLGVVVVLDFEVTSFGHVADDFCGAAGFAGLMGRQSASFSCVDVKCPLRGRWGRLFVGMALFGSGVFVGGVEAPLLIPFSK